MVLNLLTTGKRKIKYVNHYKSKTKNTQDYQADNQTQLKPDQMSAMY